MNFIIMPTIIKNNLNLRLLIEKGFNLLIQKMKQKMKLIKKLKIKKKNKNNNNNNNNMVIMINSYLYLKKINHKVLILKIK